MSRIPLIVMIAVAVLSGLGTGRAAAETRVFDAHHQLEVRLPEGATRMRLWFAIPQQVPDQRVEDFSVEAPFEYRIVEDTDGNRFLFGEVDLARFAAAGINGPGPETVRVDERFRLVRSESRHDVDPSKSRPYEPADLIDMGPFLEPDKYVVINDRIRELAQTITGGEPNPLIASRKIYDWVLENVDYWVKQPASMKASKVGSTTYCLDTGTGNCTDFHSLYASLSRAHGIPTRIVYGSLFKPELDGTETDQSYHCWIEFWAPELGWIPLDVAVADIFVDDFRLTEANKRGVELTVADGYKGPDQHMVDYYFGNLDARRVTWHRGRDLHLAPAAADEPINALPKAHVEVDGKPITTWTRKLTFVQKS